MIVGLIGVVEKKEPTLLHLNVNGVIYEVFVSLNCNASIVSKELKLHISQIIREDNNALYGFLDLDEKHLFERLLKINGVGPKVALAILSTFTPASFATVLANNDISMLKKVPGIGPKGAGRILVELSGYIVSSSNTETKGSHSEAVMALESLGFKSEQIMSVLSTCSADDTSSLVKEALKKLQK